MTSEEIPLDVYLEGSFAEAFMHLAVSEGFAKYDYLDSIMKDILRRYSSSPMRNKVLSSLMLYNNIHVVEYLDSFELENLNDLGVAIEKKPKESEARGRTGGRWAKGVCLLSEEQLNLLRLLRSAFLPYLRRKWGIKANEFDDIVECIQDPDFLWRESSKAEHYGVENLILSPLFKPISIIERDLLPILDLILDAGNKNAAIETTKVRANKLPSLGGQPNRLKDGLRAYAILIDEINMIPQPRTFEEALDFRQDSRIIDFQNTLWRWANVIRSDDLSGEKKYREELKRANKSLKRIPQLKKISRMITYVSLPANFVPYLGLPFTVLGVALQALTDRKANKLKWLMIDT